MIMEKYGSAILSSMPGFFDLTVRALINNWMEFYMGDWSQIACPISLFERTSARSIDLRDLLLSAAKSQLLGGSGSSPYGDLFRTAFGMVQDLVFKVDEITGLSAFNDIVIGPWTRSHSDSTGTMVFPGDLFNSGTRIEVGGLDATVELRARDARIDNIDTVGSPLALLEAVMGEEHDLNNTATFGVEERPLRFAVKFLISLMGDGKCYCWLLTQNMV